MARLLGVMFLSCRASLFVTSARSAAVVGTWSRTLATMHMFSKDTLGSRDMALLCSQLSKTA